MSWVTVAAESRKGGSWIRRGLAMCALMGVIGLPVTMVSCSGDDNGGGGGGGGGGNNPPPPTGGANQFAYVIAAGESDIRSFRLDGDGNIAPAGNPPINFATGLLPHHVNVDPAGRFVYVSNHDSNFISGYRINPQDGTLTPMNAAGGSPVTTDPVNEPSPHSSVLDQSGQFLYAVFGHTGTSTLRVYRVDQTAGNTFGNLTFVPGQSFLVGSHAHNITISPNNQFVYVASEGSGELFAFSRDASTGALTAQGTITGLNTPQAVTVDAQSRFLYATHRNEVVVYQIGANGALTRITQNGGAFSTGNEPHSLALHPNGQTLYVANINSSTVNVFRIDSTTGALTEIQTPAPVTGTDPNFVVVHPNGRFLFTADNVADGLSRFTINADGTLATPPTAIPAGNGTNGIGTTKLP